MSTITRVGVIGCGNIARKAYLPNLSKFPHLQLVACADLNLDVAREAATEFGIPRFLTPDDLIVDSEIDLIINLTVPQAHYPIDIAALENGKHVFSEKPFTLTREEALAVCTLAKAKDLRVGCAPDTVLGAGVQTCRQLIDTGAIGTAVSFSANMLCRGHEHWHPSPEFYYQAGGGPLFDMGPYYLHALITLLGPVARVSSATRITFPERTISSQPKAGKVMIPEVPTHLTAILELANGCVGTLTTSFDIRGGHSLPCIEIHGTKGSLQVPDPNGFGGVVRISDESGGWKEMPLEGSYANNARGLGAADMAMALLSGRLHRANDSIALHAVDIMQAIHESAELGRRVDLVTSCERPAAMRKDLPEFTLD